MNQEPNSKAAETAQTTSDPAVAPSTTCSQVFPLTTLRDRLAEALQKAKAVYTPSSGGEYQTGWHDAICWVNQQALQSLNQPTP